LKAHQHHSPQERKKRKKSEKLERKGEKSPHVLCSSYDYCAIRCEKKKMAKAADLLA